MKAIVTLAVAGLFALSTIGVANACSAHSQKTAEISKPASTVSTPVMTPKPTKG